MPKGPLSNFDWLKKRLDLLTMSVRKWDDDGSEVYSKPDFWAVKKLLAIAYYIPSFVRIASNYFKTYYYVDLFAGPGLYRVGKKYAFPGSPLVALYTTAQYQFNTYYFIDKDKSVFDALSKRVDKVCKELGSKNVEIYCENSNITAQKIFSGAKPPDKFDSAYLVFIDPEGFAEIKWDTVKRILNSGSVDIMFTFMTYGILMNINKARSDSSVGKTMDAFFGNPEWRGLSNGEELLDLYIRQIKKERPDMKTYVIEVGETKKKKFYDLIMGTSSEGGQNVMEALLKRINSITTEEMKRIYQHLVGESKPISDWFDYSEK